MQLTSKQYIDRKLIDKEILRLESAETLDDVNENSLRVVNQITLELETLTLVPKPLVDGLCWWKP